MSIPLWKQCLAKLQDELSITEFSMWIRPLQAELNKNILSLYAPNQFVLDWVRNKYLNNINELLNYFCGINAPILRFEVGNKPIQMLLLKPTDLKYESFQAAISNNTQNAQTNFLTFDNAASKLELHYNSNINPKYTFNNFVEGKSNQLACKAARRVSENLGGVYNPLLFYSRTGLGKTHLLHAVGNNIIENQVNAKILYINSECFVQNMIKALQNNIIEKFKYYYRSVDVLLMDDIQFFANKEHSQEEFFYTCNTLLENNKQIILTSDRYPKEINGLDDRLKSRFNWGLITSIELPELDTRVEILMKKAEEHAFKLNKEVAFFIAKHLRANICELEGALNCIIAHANFIDQKITIDFVREVLRDLFSLHKKLTNIDNIQKIVSEYYKIKITDLLSKRRSRSIVRPRQMAMALSKELTNHSLLEIGDAFNGRDHTTVLHACKTIEQLREKNRNIKEDFSNLIRILSF